MYDYFDYAIPERDMIVSDMKVSAFVRKELAALFKRAIDDGWDVRAAPLLLAHRTKDYTHTIRLARLIPDDILDTWARRGWTIEPLPDWIRAELLRIFTPAVVG